MLFDDGCSMREGEVVILAMDGRGKGRRSK
jgi:hypothetical protein